MLPKNKAKLLLNMLLIAAHAIPRGGSLTVDPIGEGEGMGFKVSASGMNARVPQSMPHLLSGQTANGPVDAHAIQPFYAGMLARTCGLEIAFASEGETVVVTAK
jgi:histidine phosphotransferase ChpT